MLNLKFIVIDILRRTARTAIHYPLCTFTVCMTSYFANEMEPHCPKWTPIREMLVALGREVHGVKSRHQNSKCFDMKGALTPILQQPNTMALNDTCFKLRLKSVRIVIFGDLWCDECFSALRTLCHVCAIPALGLTGLTKDCSSREKGFLHQNM